MMSLAYSEIICLRGLLTELGFPQHAATPFYAGNTSAIQIAANLVFHEHTKYIEVDYHSICESLVTRIVSPPQISLQL